ncbi:hypothetical protein K3495_g11570 [Podosphaera aphanis]|nr:hypothetical protein K3495_g11570 [Podosphaera aphanis]
MHDKAPSHKAAFTRKVLIGRNIKPIVWPAFSPDLNPIETLWSQMKHYIEVHYPDLEQEWERTSAELRAIILKAWNSISPDFPENLVRSIPERCYAVFEANGGAPRF